MPHFRGLVFVILFRQDKDLCLIRDRSNSPNILRPLWLAANFGLRGFGRDSLIRLEVMRRRRVLQLMVIDQNLSFGPISGHRLDVAMELASIL